MDEPSTTPSTAPEDRGVRYASARDYLRVIRRHILIVVALTLLTGGAAFVLSIRQDKIYGATAALSFRDPLADTGVIGSESIPEASPQTRAAVNAELVTSPRVVRRAQRALDTNIDSRTLTSSVTATVSASTTLVVVTAQAAQPQLAADIANAFARAAKQEGDRAIQRRLNNAVKVLKDRVKFARKDLGKGGTTGFQLASLTDQLSRVQTLKGIAEPVQITSEAAPPGVPISPRPKRNTVLGLFVGLVAGLFAAFTRDVFDRRFRTAHEVQQELGYAVLSRVSDSALGKPGLARASANGAGAMKEADFEAFRVLRTNLAYLSGGKRTGLILVTSGLPEEGKSTVSMALASAAAVAGQRALLIECDFRRPTFAKRLGVNPAPGLADYLRGEADPGEVVTTVELTAPTGANGNAPEDLVPPEARMACIPCGSHAADAVELLDSDRFRDFLTTVSRAYDFVVIDSSPLLAVVDPLRIAPFVDALLICVRVKRSTREEVRAVRSALANLPEQPTGAVVTGLSRDGPDSYDYYYGY